MGLSAEHFDVDRHHALAREAAARSIVLLKNDTGLLPLRPAGRIAVLGRFAAHPRYQGGGSSHVNATRIDVPLDEIRALAAEAEVTFALGWDEDDAEAVAVQVAAAADVAVVFLGLGESLESEGFDRDGIDLPAVQLALLRAVVAVQPNTVVVLSHGGVVALAEVVDAAPAILDGALLGQAGGGAIADVLFGVVNPSGKLTETVPARLQDAPSYGNFPGEASRVLYGESIFVGYRWYDLRELPVAFPFGHGLSYTTFGYGPARASCGDGGLGVSITITNTGERTGREVVQLYVSLPGTQVRRAPKELKDFAVVNLEPGTSAEVELFVPREQLAYWDERVPGWVVEGGTYELLIGASSRDIRQRVSVEVPGDSVVLKLTPQSTFGEVLSHPVAGPMLAAFRSQHRGDAATATAGAALGSDVERMAAWTPLDRLATFSGGQFDAARVAALLERANAGLDATGQDR
jgi:beta-glucosidase